jgi:hypothetical protein
MLGDCTVEDNVGTLGCGGRGTSKWRWSWLCVERNLGLGMQKLLTPQSASPPLTLIRLVYARCYVATETRWGRLDL